MKVNTIMNLACVRLDVKAKDFEKVAKYNPDAMTLYKGEDENRFPLYKLSLGSCNDECCIAKFNNVGAKFVDVDGVPTLWICMPEEALKDKTKYLTDEHGMTLSYIKEIEKQINDAVSGVNAKVEALKGVISDVFAPATV